jgi:hypothetical protein
MLREPSAASYAAWAGAPQLGQVLLAALRMNSDEQ